MKSRFLSLGLIFFISFSSCKKDFFPGIAGSWYSVAEYRQQQNGYYEWMPADDRSRFQYIFYSEGKFTSFSDVPAGGGTYNYDHRSGNLILNYEANIYGGIAYTLLLKVENLDNDKLIIAHFSGTGSLFNKTEFTKAD